LSTGGAVVDVVVDVDVVVVGPGSVGTGTVHAPTTSAENATAAATIAHLRTEKLLHPRPTDSLRRSSEERTTNLNAGQRFSVEVTEVSPAGHLGHHCPSTDGHVT
jgi:hypothetical protein